MFFLGLLFGYLFSAGTGHRKVNGILHTSPATIQAVKIQCIFGPKAPDVFSWLTFFDTCFRLEQAIEKSTEFCKQDLPRFRQLKYNIFLGPRPQMFFLGLLFSIPVFGRNRLLKKTPEFDKQDLPRFRQLKYNIFLGPRLQMFFLGLLSLILVFGLNRP